MSTRARAGKFQKAKRGGGRSFSKNLRPLDADGVERSMWAEPNAKDDEEESSEEDSEEDSDDDEDDAPAQSQQQEMTREERRAAQKIKKEAAIKKKQGTVEPGDLPSDDSEDEDEEMPANPNHSTAARKMAEKGAVEPSTATKSKKPDDVSQLSRREREALQAQQSKERYQKLHAEGKTEEARADMERLKLVRQQREEAAARKEAEKQEKELIESEKKEQLDRLERQQAQKANRGGRGAKKGGKS